MLLLLQSQVPHGRFVSLSISRTTVLISLNHSLHGMPSWSHHTLSPGGSGYPNQHLAFWKVLFNIVKYY